MADMSAFLAGQQKVYGKFDAATQLAQTQFLNPDPVVRERKAGCMVALRPHNSITKFLDGFSRQLPDVVAGAVPLFKSHFHTTLSDWGVAGRSLYENPEFDRTVLTKLATPIKDISGRMSAPSCRYTGLVFNETSIILKGEPNEEFLLLAECVVAAAKKLGIELRMPWGAHVTVGRFAQAGTSQEACALARLCAEYSAKLPDHLLPYDSMFVGEFLYSEYGFNVIPYRTALFGDAN